MTQAQVRIAVIGDFNPEYESHHAINASLGHAAVALALNFDLKWIATSCAARDAEKILRKHDGLYIARTHGWPLIGITAVSCPMPDRAAGSPSLQRRSDYSSAARHAHPRDLRPGRDLRAVFL